jgi:hypothetical protein
MKLEPLSLSLLLLADEISGMLHHVLLLSCAASSQAQSNRIHRSWLGTSTNHDSK